MTARTTTRPEPHLARSYLLMSAGILGFLAVIGALGWTLTVLAQG